MTFKPIETQEAFDAAVKERIERAKKSAAERFSDYDELKAELAKYKDAEESGKSEIAKLTEKVAAMEKDKADREEAAERAKLRQKVASELKVPENMVHGDDEDAMRESAKAALEYAKAYKPTAPSVPGAGKSDPAASSGKDDGMAEFVSQLFGEVN